MQKFSSYSNKYFYIEKLQYVHYYQSDVGNTDCHSVTLQNVLSIQHYRYLFEWQYNKGIMINPIKLTAFYNKLTIIT